MLKAKGLHSLLEQIFSSTPGTSCIALINIDGAILSHQHLANADVRVLSAVVSSAWAQFEKHGRTAFCGEDQLNCLLFECDRGRVGVARIVGNILVCLQTDASIEYGALKSKLLGVVSCLKEPLSHLSF